MYEDFHKTPYETEPVECIMGAMRAFVKAYDHLQNILPIEFDPLAEALRLTMYSPVWPEIDSDSPPISLYEIGVTQSPHRSVAGRYSIHEGKLTEALEHRAEDIRALLIQESVQGTLVLPINRLGTAKQFPMAQEDSGILPRLCDILAIFIDEEREEKLPEDVYTATMRFLNECRRLIVMWESV